VAEVSQQQLTAAGALGSQNLIDRYTRKKYIIRMNSVFKIRWDMVILVISVWNSFSIPIDIAFGPEIFEETPNVVVNHLIDIYFALDIILHFRTTIINEATGEEIKEPKLIALTYLKGRFIIDLLATVPFDTIFYGLLG